MNNILVITSIFFALAAILITLVFLRPAVEREAFGKIIDKSKRDAHTYTQQQPGGQRGFRSPTEIAMPESTVLSIELEGIVEPVRYSVNTLAGQEFEVGQRVRVKYQERGLKPIWHRVYVMDVVSEN